MKTHSSAIATTLAAFCLLMCQACRSDSLADRFDKLPELPDDIAATLDPNTMATAVTSVFVAPVFDSEAALAPCCSSQDEKALRVTFPYTKCAPLRDFILVPLQEQARVQAGLGSGQPAGAEGGEPVKPKVWKLTKRKVGTVLDRIVCVTSDGPWNASLTETRACSPPTPHQSLRIAPYGDLVTFEWNGEVALHPSNVGLVTCRQVSVNQANCGISTCDCLAFLCPANEPCDCGLSGSW